MFKLTNDENVLKNMSGDQLLTLAKNKHYNPADLNNDKSNLNYLGQSFLAIDQCTNNNINSLFIAIDVNSDHIFKTLIYLLKQREQLRELNTNIIKMNVSKLDFIVNRKYDKYQQTLILKATKKENLDLLKAMVGDVGLSNMKSIDENMDSKTNLSNSNKENEFNVYINLNEVDKEKQNALHYAINAKNENLINFLVKRDADKNILRTSKDAKNKTPEDYDTSNHYKNNLVHIWDAAKNNDLVLLEKLLNKGFYTINEQTFLFKNTPLHIAAANSADKVTLYLVKNGCDTNIINNRNLKAVDIGAKNADKIFRKKFAAIINKEITEFYDLEMFLNKNNITSISNIAKYSKKVEEIKEKINESLKNKKLDYKQIFDKIDENGDGIYKLLLLGKLQGYEFETLFSLLNLDITYDEILILMSNLDRNKNGTIEYSEYEEIFRI